MIIAGLDIATKTGVCVGKPGHAPVFWTENLGERLPHEQRFSNALRLAHRLVTQHGITFIGIEAPIIVPKRDNKAMNELLMGLVACVRGWAAMKGIACQRFEVATIDKHFIGQRVKGRAARKAANLARCHQLGWAPKTEDESDAGAVFDLACALQNRAHAVQTAPLIAAGLRGWQ
jgi:hypothetical protein